MSKRGYTSKREAVIKQARATARREQTCYKDVFPQMHLGMMHNWQHKYVKVAPPAKGNGKTRSRIPLGKEPDTRFTAGRRTVFPKEVCLSDGSEDFNEAEFFESLWAPRPSRSTTPMKVSWDDLPVRIAKPKGLKKEYEFVDPVKKVVALDDDVDTALEDDWETIYTEPVGHAGTSQTPYATVVRGGG